MKRLIFLISLCLLSQNLTIASETVGDCSKMSAPVPAAAKANVSAVVKSPVPAQKKSASTSVVKKQEAQKIVSKSNQTTRIASAPVPAAGANVSVAAKSPVPAVKKTTPPVAAKPVPTNTTKKSPVSVSLQKKNTVVNTTASKPVQNRKVVSKPVLPPVPGTAKSPVLQDNQNIKEAVQKQETKPKRIVKTAEQIEQEYIQALEDEKKYKFYDNKKLQNAVNPIPLPTKDTKKLKQKRPPVIVENNLSKPGDSDEVRAKIVRVEFSESKIFTPEELQQLASPLLSQPVTIDDIKKVVNGITRCYILGDYVTSKAYLPPQDLTDGVLKIGLMEGTVGDIKVEGNRWTRDSFIKKRVNQKEGDILKISDIEKDVIKFNNNNTAKIKVGLSAGEEQGQTDITLNTMEPFPFRLAFMTDNQGRQAVGVGRFGTMLTTDSLFGFRDRFSVGGYLGRGNRVGFMDYNIPVGKYGTRVGASVSAGNISVVNGPMRAFGVGGTSQVYSVYATHPLFDRQDVNISSYTAANIKHSTSDIADFKFYDKSTFSVTQGFTARKDTDKGIWFTGHYGSAGFKALSGDTDFFKYEGNITRLHDFGKGIIGQFRISGQYSPNDDLPWMEQFQIGGLSTVRGYSEGLLLGKSGYFASAEIITPLPFLPKRVGSDRLGYIYPREMVKGAVFWDNGMIFPYKADGSSIDSGEFLMSWGLGLRVNIRQDLAARMYWGFGLNNKYDMDQKFGRFHFDITCAPDIGRVVASRKPRKKDTKKENL